MKIMKHVPNFITCLNLFSGCLACVAVLHFSGDAKFLAAFCFIALAAVFDFLDGFAARLLHAPSKIGTELDSLADVVSFGVAPGCIVYVYLEGITDVIAGLTCNPLPGIEFLGFLLPIFAALRLAKFNLDTRQTTSFLGLPVPSCALFFASFIPSINAVSVPCKVFIVLALVLVFCALMVSEVPMLALKFKNASWRNNKWSFSVVIVAIILIGVCAQSGNPLLGVCLAIVAYVLLSLLHNIVSSHTQPHSGKNGVGF
ncbi:CDP-alcohol phosphatidyltransferase family protein [Candidatus Symbiothrix dinenymphae]|uniref:CDP-alcohol phosphatidyltransferase family protein n=1 Tax=Candidatus Symbiothrix dinenymphae TaxID=467085 RepID=UPI000A649B57